MSARRDDQGGGMALPQFAWPRLTPAVKALLLLLAASYLPTFALYLYSDSLYASVVGPLQLDADDWTAGFPAAWQLFTYGLIHSPVDLLHLLGNGLLLYFFGTMLEEHLGSRRFVLTYLGAQIAGGVAFLVTAWLGMRTPPVVGASGACYGIMIAAATLFPRRLVYLLFIPILLKWLALFIVVVTVFAALVQMKQGASGTAHLVHLGGIAYGWAAVVSGLVRKDPVEILERRRAVQEVERAAADAARLDQLLEKIAREGIGSLSRGEREFLKRASSRR